MGTYIYNETVVYTPENNETYAAKRSYKIRPCQNTLIPNNQADLWCNNLCSQDEEYCNPFVKGDKIYFQYFSDNSTLWKVLPKIYDTNTGLIIPSVAYITTQSGTDANGNAYLNLVIDTLNLPIDCFYLSVYLFACEVNPVQYTTCYNDAIAGGATPEEAEFDCSVYLCGEGVSQIISEPYCARPCEKTLLLEGIYPAYDCNGKYYGQLSVGSPPSIQASIYKAQIRIPAELNKQAFSFTNTVVNGNKQSSKQKTVYQLLTPLLPPYVAEQIAVCFNAKQVFVNGMEFDSGPDLTKNNDEGQMWLINAKLTSDCQEINFTCE